MRMLVLKGDSGRQGKFHVKIHRCLYYNNSKIVQCRGNFIGTLFAIVSQYWILENHISYNTNKRDQKVMFLLMDISLLNLVLQRQTPLYCINLSSLRA